jgi:hypothetical protein
MSFARLERVAFRRADGGGALLAKTTALRMLVRLNGATKTDIPVDDEGRFHLGPPEMSDLDRYDSDEKRECWLRSWLKDTNVTRHLRRGAGGAAGAAGSGLTVVVVRAHAD